MGRSLKQVRKFQDLQPCLDWEKTQHDFEKQLMRMKILAMSPNPRGACWRTGVMGCGTITYRFHGHLQISCWLKQVSSAQLSRKPMTALLSECTDGENPVRHRWGSSAETVSLWGHNSRQTAIPSTNIYTVLGTENAIKNESYEAPHFIEIPI